MGTSGQMTSLPAPQFPIGFPMPLKGYPLAWLVSRFSVQSGDTTAVNPRTGQDMGNRLGGQPAVAAACSQAKIPDVPAGGTATGHPPLPRDVLSHQCGEWGDEGGAPVSDNFQHHARVL